MKITLKEAFYYLFIIFIMLYYSFRRTNIDYSNFEICLYLAIPFLIAKLYITKYTMREAVMILILVLLGGYSAIYVGNTSILIAFCVIAGMKNMDYTNVLKVIFWMRLLVTIYVFIAVKIGWITDTVVIRGDDYRYSMGYSHPNTFGFYCFVLISLWFALYGKENWKLKWLVAFVITILQYYYTRSNTSLILLLAFLLLILLDRFVNLHKFIKKIAFISFPIMAIMSFVFPLLLQNSIIAMLDSMMSSRLTLSAYYLNNYGVGLLGKSIITSIDANSYLYLDSGYLNLFIIFGFIIGIIVILLLMNGVRKLNCKCSYIFIAAIVFAIYATIENVLGSMLFNYFFVIAGAAFYQQIDNEL